jgi:hypothetical protein
MVANGYFHMHLNKLVAKQREPKKGKERNMVAKKKKKKRT